MSAESIGTISATLVDRWLWWQSALKSPAEIGKSLKMAPDSPEQGYYRTRFKDKPFEPVAIWFDEDTRKWLAYRSNREVDAAETWNWCCRFPISYEQYQRAVDGGGWADDDPTVAAQIAPPAPGHNSGDVSESEMLRDQIEAAKQGAKAYAVITDDETAAKAQSLRARMNELSGDADKKREKLKRPHLEAGNAIDKEWQPLVKEAKAVADTLRKSIEAHETVKLNARRAAERAAEQERLRLEREAQKAAEAGQPVVPPEPVQAPVAVAPAPIKGTYGKAATVKAKIVVTRITDATALFGFFNGHPKLDDLLIKLAQDAIDAGQAVPGIETEERARIVS